MKKITIIGLAATVAYFVLILMFLTVTILTKGKEPTFIINSLFMIILAWCVYGIVAAIIYRKKILQIIKDEIKK